MLPIRVGDDHFLERHSSETGLDMTLDWGSSEMPYEGVSNEDEWSSRLEDFLLYSTIRGVYI